VTPTLSVAVPASVTVGAMIEIVLAVVGV